jgi:hypothetical protein
VRRRLLAAAPRSEVLLLDDERLALPEQDLLGAGDRPPAAGAVAHTRAELLHEEGFDAVLVAK